LAGRATGNAVDQGLSSLTNAGSVLLAAGAMGARDFGWFSLGVTIAALAISLTRPLTGMLLVLVAADREGTEGRQADRWAAGAGVFWGSAVGAGIVAAGLLLPVGGRAAIVTIGLCLPALILQDSLRYVAFRGGRPWSAALSDTVWLGVAVALLVALRVLDVASPSAYLIAWALGAVAGSWAALGHLRLRPDVRAGVRWSWGNRHVGRYLLAELAAAHGSSQLAILIVGGIVGAAAIGAFRGGLTLVGPLTVVQMATIAFALPELVRRPHLSPRRRLVVALLIGGPLCVAALLVGMAYQVLPRDVGVALLGEAWGGASEVVFPLAVWTAAAALSIGPLCQLQTMGRADLAARISGVLAPLLLAGAWLGTHVDGIRGGAWGMAVAQAAVLLLWWPTLLHQSRRRSVAGDAGLGMSPDECRSAPDTARGQ
jgi:hypothetical protein